MTKEEKQTLEDIHRSVHSGFRYMEDIDQFDKEEFWMLSPDLDNVTGDCDEFAIACRHLVKANTNLQSRLVICETEEGGLHMICAVEDDDFEHNYILDNRRKPGDLPSKKRAERLGYKFLYASGLEKGQPWLKLF